MLPKPEEKATHRSRWVLQSSDPRTAWGWIWGTRRRRLPSDRQWKIVGLISLGALPFIGLSLFLGPQYMVVAIFFIAWASFLLRPLAREHSMLPTVSDRETFPVSLKLWEKGELTGTDLGWVGFADGWLVYEGLRTNFSLTSSGPSSETLHGIRLVLPDDQTAELTFLRKAPLNPWTVTKPENLFQRALKQWRAQPTPAGDPVLPPLKTHPNTAAERLKNLFAGAAMGLTAGIILGALDFWIFSAGCFLGSILLFATFAKNLRQFHAEFDRSFGRPGIEKETEKRLERGLDG